MPHQSAETLNWNELDRAEIERQLLPQFPSRFEQSFLRDRALDRNHTALTPLIIAMVFFNFGAFGDYAIDHTVLGRSLIIHLFFYTPVILVSIFLLRRTKQHTHQEFIKFVLPILAAATSFLIFYQPSNLAAVVMASRSIVMVTFGALILRQTLLSTFLINLILAVGQALFLLSSNGITSATISICSAMSFAATIMSMLGCHKMERTERVAYLLLRQSETNATQLRRANRELAAIAQSDGLTGLSNRRHFEAVSQSIWQERDSDAFPASLIMADIDHFKRLNDTHGHLAGDEVIIQVAQLLRASVRSGQDVVARYGGEEFILLLPGMDAEKALEIAERITAAVRQSRLEVPSAAEPMRVTISCGVATVQLPDQSQITELIAAADQALYQSKHSGRDQVTFHTAQLQPA